MEELTLKKALEIIEIIEGACADFKSEYDTSMDDPKNNVEGWKITDKAEDFLDRTGCVDWDFLSILKLSNTNEIDEKRNQIKIYVDNLEGDIMPLWMATAAINHAFKNRGKKITITKLNK